jgi:ATP-dependent DNA ligase
VEVVGAILPWMREGDWYALDEECEIAEQLWLELVEDGDWEGLIFRRPDGSVARMKKLVTMDYVCMGVAESDSETFKGQARALLGGLYIADPADPSLLVLKQIVSISGLTAAQREAFWARRDELEGLVFEASGKVVFKSGALRHPSFERWRDDKLAADCVWPQED